MNHHARITTPALLLGVAIAVLQPLDSHAQGFDPPESEYTRTLWTARDGLPSARVSAIAQDANGFLWLTTTAGLTRFDGRRFKIGGALDERSQRPVGSALVTRDGSLWFAFLNSTRVGRLIGGRLTIYADLPGPVAALIQTRDGTLWAGGVGGVSIFRNDRWEPVGRERLAGASTVDALLEDQTGNLWVGASDGIYRRAAGAGALELVVRRPGSTANSLTESADGDVIVNDPQHTIRSLSGSEELGHKVGRFRFGNALHILFSRDGSLWMATDNGVIRFADYPRGRIERVTSDDGVTTLFEDRDQNIWMGTVDGLVRLSRARIVSFSSTDRSISSIGKVVAAAADGSVWAAAPGGVVRFFERRQTFFRAGTGFPGQTVRALHGSRDGAVWIGTDTGLIRYLNGRFHSFPLPEHPGRHRVRSITSDLDGNVWVSDLQGLYQLRNGHLAAVDFLDRPAFTLRAIHADRRGRLWVGLYEGGLGVYGQGGLRWYSERDGLALGPVLSITEDTRGVIWVATTRGISRFENDQLTTVIRGIPTDVIAGFVADVHGYLWISVNSAIIRLDQQQFEKAGRDPSYSVQPLLYDATDGLVGAPRYDGGTPNATRANDGTLWFPTTHGVAMMDPGRVRDALRPPPVFIESASAGNRQYPVDRLAQLPADASVVEVEYTAPAVSAETKVRFRHKLDGFDEDWVLDGDGSRRVLYTNLFPGTYRLRINASYGDGVWSVSDAVWQFSVAPRFYQTRSFYAICALALGLVVWGAWQARLRGIRRKFAVVLGERARVGREIHDTLLQSLVGLALQLDNIATEFDTSRESAKQQLGSLRRQVERSVREANQSIWQLRSPVRADGDFPSVLREHVEHIVRTSGAQLQFVTNAPRPQCAPAVEEQLLRIAQEAVTNAVRHARPSQIRIELFYDADSVRLSVSDDGSGFDPTPTSQNAGRHWGLTIMQERAQQIGGRLTLASVANEGTKIEVVAPCSEGS